MDKFEVRWTKDVAINFYGTLVRPQGIILVSATLAIQLHNEKEGWVCDDINKAVASLDKKDVVITDQDVTVDLGTTPASENQSSENATMAPSADGQTSLLQSIEEFKCEKCGKLFPAKRNLVAHIAAAHKDE